MSIEKFIRNAVTGWMTADGENSDIVLSTRIRLARNLRGYCFPIAVNGRRSFGGDKMVAGALLDADRKRVYLLLKMSELPALEREVLVEKHLISPQLAAPNTARGSLVVR